MKSNAPSDDDPVRRLAEAIQRRYAPRITGELTLPAQAARYAALPATLHADLRKALAQRQLSALYTHQRQTWDAVTGETGSNGSHVVVVTPTASGKSLAYHLPVVDGILKRRGKALYLFPTKALAQDQLADLMELDQQGGLGLRCFTFDGDTPGDARKAVRTRGDLVLSNPDMLHQAILPHHTKWASFFENLAYVVIDELHVYRGVFGSHVANVIRRLHRVARFYGVEPRFIMASATIGNPGELASRLIGAPVVTVDDNGAPRSARRLLLWNPPIVNRDLGIRRSARSQTNRLARLATRAGLKGIIFARSRLMVEVLAKYLKDVFDRDPRRPPRVIAYRGGYLPEERRGMERRLRAGDIQCVIATSALELGVDIGALDFCILNGYPGTIAATWQRLGRAGRRARSALGVLVASSDPLDQYLVRHPEFFLGASPENARIDPDQLLILLAHIRCAAFELPFEADERFGAEPLGEMLAYLEEEGEVIREGPRWHWTSAQYPAHDVSLRSVAEGNFVVIDTSEGGQRILAEVDYTAVPMTLYEGAIYMIQAHPYQVEHLDWEGRKAFVTPTRADYYTDAIDYTRLKILDRFEARVGSGSAIAHGEVHLVRHFPGYKKIRYYTHENIGYGNINLPDQEMHTTAVWWQLAPQRLETELDSREQALEGFLGAAHALHQVAVLASMAEPRDLGHAVGDGEHGWFASVGPAGRTQLRDGRGPVESPQALGHFEPAVFLYDNYPGGIGLSAPLFDQGQDLVQQAAELIRDCGCPHGCPVCIGPILADEAGQRLQPKQTALVILDWLQDAAASGSVEGEGAGEGAGQRLH
jgi:DEAD/DEAH box helicase domain-containing protein